MKKLSLLLGAVGGAMAGYVFSNARLRDELARAKDADDVSAVLKRHVRKDAQKLGRDLRHFLESEEVAAYVEKVRQVAKKGVDEAARGVQSIVREGEVRAKKALRETRVGAKRGRRRG